MWFPRCNLWKILNCVASTALVLAGCGNSCFVATSNNGTGRIVVKAGDPPPTCSLSMGMGMMGAMAVKSPACVNCTAAARLEHVFVTVRSVQVGTMEGTKRGDWIELAPGFKDRPRQIDLIGNDKAEILAEGVSVPAGSYGEVRVQFVTAAGAEEELKGEDSCGATRWNCVVRGDGNVEAVGLAGGVAEIVIPLESGVVVLPDSKVGLELRLESQQVLSTSGRDGLKMQNVLVGSGRGLRKDSATE